MMKTVNSRAPIGIFDSGLGGLSTTGAICNLLPQEDLLYFGDSIHNPYGTKSREQIIQYCTDICDAFEKQNVKAIVIACNTATSAAVPVLRQRYDFDIIGVEPALKPAAMLGEHQKIAVWATKLTLEEEKFARLLHRFDQDHQIRRVACPRLVRLVEEDRLDDQEAVDAALWDYLEQSNWEELDSIVLGCTHFVFFKDRLAELTQGKVHLIDGNEGTARHLREVLATKDLLNPQETGSLHLDNSDPGKLQLSSKLVQKAKEISQ